MAGACPPERAAAVARAGGMGGFGVLVTPPDRIGEWVTRYRALGGGPLQMNLWVPDTPPVRNREHESEVARFLAQWGPPVPPDAADTPLLDFEAQCAAMLAARPTVVSSVMGLYARSYVDQLRRAGIAWFATVTTVAEARAAQAAGADAIIAQGMEAGGHRGAFEPEAAERSLVGLFALVPRVVDVVSVPVIAAGGIGDGRTVAAALLLGASAVMVGTALLRCSDSRIPKAWRQALEALDPEGTMLTRAFSGRCGRAVATEYVRAAAAPSAPFPVPYPIQRGLTAPMRAAANKRDDLAGMQAWAGQGAALGRDEPAESFVQRIWTDAVALLPAQRNDTDRSNAAQAAGEERAMLDLCGYRYEF